MSSSKNGITLRKKTNEGKLEKISIEIKYEETDHRHSICIGKKMAYCMDCGQILLEYKKKDDFYKWLRSFEEFVSN